MPEQTGGYGPPRVHSFSAELVAPPAAKRAAPAAAAAAAPSRARVDAAVAGAAPRVRVTVRGEGFIHRAMPLIVQIGDQLVLNCEVSHDETTIVCLLDELPEDGAVIRVGYGRHEMVELPERFSHARLSGRTPDAG
jgi:hypothetical protein